MTSNNNSIQFHDYQPKLAQLGEAVIHGLSQHPRSIPPKFFYDQTGSEIFDDICETDEYYVARTEIGILENHRKDIAKHVGTGCLLIEPGSGNSQKVRILLDALRPHAYLPMDISRDYLQFAAQQLANDYPWLEIHAACIDYSVPIDLPFAPVGTRKVAFFPGSSIGNFERGQAKIFLRNIANMVEPGGGLLIGVDLKKDPSLLHAAYNDADGNTAAFNLNLLTRVNRELGSNFDLDGFSHHAFYNEEHGRVEMHLVCEKSQYINIHSKQFHFSVGESIHTENSYKYHIDDFQELAQQAGFRPIKVWSDEDHLFSVHYLEAEHENN
ncbi:MAG: L-histidine N(alpha)-methyltransferase [Gammaproteobacteria bacterium]|nr:L-histidine N(alpha)-methyltransferase [Gammaproteobacteria bacterium]